jgi:hypothetical protein
MTVRAVFLVALLASATVVLLSEDPASGAIVTFSHRASFGVQSGKSWRPGTMTPRTP